MKLICTLIIMLIALNSGFSQIVIIIPIQVSEHGFLPGKKFPIFPTIDKYDFQGLKLCIDLYDDRESLKLQRINCSEIDLNNTSEFASPQTIFKVKQYIDTLFSQSKIFIDSTSDVKLEVRLEAIDSRLIGSGYIKAHGLCQIRIKYKGLNKIYCTDIVDGDKNSPLGSKEFATRLTATRYMASASIRETIEQFLIDLKTIK